MKKTIYRIVLIMGWIVSNQSARSESEATWRAPVDKVLLAMPSDAPAEVDHIARVFERHLRDRAGVEMVREGAAPLTVRFVLDQSLGAECFMISDDDPDIVITGGDALGLLFGVGKLLRISRFDQGGFGLVHEVFGEDCTTSISTWGCKPTDWYGLWKKNDPAWLDNVLYVLGDERKLADQKRLPKHVRGLNFPDICNGRRATVWIPRGGFGANPVPELLQVGARFYKGQDGGFPYSEGIWDDLNKALVAHLYWMPGGDAQDALREYISSRFSPDVVEEVVEAIGILEANSGFSKSQERNEELAVGGRNAKPAPADAPAAFVLMQKANEKLPEIAKKSWRWRILYLRAQIDAELHKNGGKLEGAVLQVAFDELRQIYQYEKKPLRYVGVPMQKW